MIRKQFTILISFIDSKIFLNRFTIIQAIFRNIGTKMNSYHENLISAMLTAVELSHPNQVPDLNVPDLFRIAGEAVWLLSNTFSQASNS